MKQQKPDDYHFCGECSQLEEDERYNQRVNYCAKIIFWALLSLGMLAQVIRALKT